jgi:hypothetical protein
MKRISNKNSSEYVYNQVEFKANNIFSEKCDNIYIVYSYGHHFPMYVNYNSKWYENSDKYSVSTSKQQTQARPVSDTIKKTTKELKDIIYNKSLKS